MDDILQRMLAVEKEAEALTTEKSEEARKILEAARKSAADLAARAQEALQKEVEELTATAMAAAEVKRQQKLQEAEEKMKTELAVFREKIAPRKIRMTEALLFGTK